MIVKHFLPRTGIRELGAVLDAYSLRQRITAENVANVQTPGYKTRKVTFEENLEAAGRKRLQMTQVQNPPGSIPINAPGQDPAEVKEIRSEYFNGVNDVDMEKEMTDLAKTTLAYNMVARLTKGRIETLKSSINGRAR